VILGAIFLICNRSCGFSIGQMVVARFLGPPTPRDESTVEGLFPWRWFVGGFYVRFKVTLSYKWTESVGSKGIESL